MAAGVKMVLTFETMTGTKSVTLNYAEPGARLADVKALGAAFISNGALFKAPPLALKAAKTVTTSENEYDLS